MNKKVLTGLGFAGACIFMGVSMPSCPGQQAMQQQVDSLQAKNVELTRQVQTTNTQVTGMRQELTQVKNLLEQVGNTVVAQKEAIKQVDDAVKAMATKSSKSSKGAKRRR